MFYPDDDNGNVLRRIAAQGKDLTQARNIDFVIVFAQASLAEQFAEYFRELGYAVSVEDTASFEDAEKEDAFPWDVIVVKHMIPTHEGTTDFENLLQSVADGWNGHNDGWGVLSPPSTH
jgi:DNA-binding MurR/RpiR family transcriptional regulator